MRRGRGLVLLAAGPARSVLVLALLCTSAVLSAGDAEAAAPRAPVRLHLDACIEAQAAVRRLFTIEIDVELVGEDAPGAAEVRALCPEAGGLVELRVDDPLTGKALQRSIDLLGAPRRARPRLLALAMAELLFASWTELELQREVSGSAELGEPAEGRAGQRLAGVARAPIAPADRRAPPPSPVERAAADRRAAAAADPPAAPPPMDRAAAAAARRAARAIVQRRLPGLAPPTGLRLTARAAGQLFLQGGALLGGAALQLGGDHGRRLGWSFDAAYLYGQTSSALGTLGADAISGGLSLSFQHPIERRGLRLVLRAGGGLRAGAARLRGTPASGARAEGATFWAPLVGPTGVLAASLGLPRRLVLDLMIEGGYLLTPAYGLIDGARALSLAGPWLGLQLGIGVMP